MSILGSRTLVRPLLAAPFIFGGLRTFRAAERVAPMAADVALPIAEAVGLPKDPVLLVKISAGVQIGAGALLVLGIFPRTAALTLAASVVPTTIAGHRFWEKSGTERTQEMTQFIKNAGMFGGLLAHALDTGGRPSVFWSGRRAAGSAAGAVSSAAHSVADTVGSAYHALPVTS